VTLLSRTYTNRFESLMQTSEAMGGPAPHAVEETVVDLRAVFSPNGDSLAG